jgi:RNA polymerase sigma factor (sigma-70 family)
MYKSCPAIDRSELMQEGVVGLLRALERFDPALGTPFWAYATWWVRQAMQQLVAELARPIVLSDRALRQLARLKSADREFAQRHGRAPTNTELAREVGVPSAQVESLMAAVRPCRPLDEPVGGEDGGATLAELLSDPQSGDPYEDTWRRLSAADLPAMLAALDEREHGILRGRFGLDGTERTLAQVGESLGVSAERVRQLEQSALEKLRRVAGVETTAAAGA